MDRKEKEGGNFSVIRISHICLSLICPFLFRLSLAGTVRDVNVFLEK